MKVYHGTSLKAAESIMQRGIILSRSKEYTDFGRGFYTTEHYEYAEKTALNKERQSKVYGKVLIPAVIELEVEDFSEDSGLNVYEFEEENLEWLQFVINNRNGIAYVENIKSKFHNLGFIYDIVKGRIADGKVSQLADVLLKNKIPVSIMDIKNIVYVNNPYASQISFHTPKALSYIKPIRIIREVK